MAKDTDVLKDAKEAYDQATDAESEQRQAMLDDLRFAKLGEQWDDVAVQQRKREGRPCLTINRLPAFIKQVTNDARQNKPAITCHPIGDKADRETAEILNGLIRNIEYTSNADVAYDTALDFSVTCGLGYFTVRTDYASEDSFDQDIVIERVSNPFTIYGDPRSQAADSSDWNVAFITDFMSDKEFKAKYPDAKETDFESMRDAKDLAWFSDDSIRVAEYWTRQEVPTTLLKLSDGSLMMEAEYLKIKDICDIQGITVKGTRDTRTHKVTQQIITGAEVLETNKWMGKYIPIIPVYGDEINIEGKRSWTSLVRPAKDAQRNFNYWRTAATELVALQPKMPFIGPAGAFTTDAKKWATANSVSHAYIEYDGQVAPQRQGFAGPPAGALQEAANASDDMKSIMGLYDASLGARSNETSGRAIMARQREGDVSTFNFIDNLNRAIRHGGRILVDLIPKVYNTERIVRCIKEDGTNYSVPINQPVQQQPQQEGQPPVYQPAQIPPELAEEMKGLVKVFDLAAGKYDVTCEAGPSFTSRREEASEQMMEFIRVFPQAAPMVGDLLAKNLDWPGSDDIAKRLQAMLPPQAMGGKPPQLMQAEEAIQQLQQQIGQMQQALNEKQTDAGFKAKELEQKDRELSIKEFEAQAKSQPGEAKNDHNFDQWKTQFAAEQARALEAQKQEGAERLELIKQGQPAIVAQEVAEQLGQVLEPVLQQLAGVGQGLQGLGQTVGALQAHATAPRKKVRGPDGKLIGVEINGTLVPIEGI